jgi:hypothetical protein
VRVLQKSLTSCSAIAAGVSVRVSDPLDAIAYPDAVTLAAIDGVISGGGISPAVAVLPRLVVLVGE